MFHSKECAYKLLGVYHICREPRDVMNTPRDFVGIGYRVRGNSTFTYDRGSFFAGDGSTLFLPAGTAFRNKHDSPEELIIIHLQPFGSVPDDFFLYRDTALLEPMFRKLLDAWENGTYNGTMGILYEIFDALDTPDIRCPEVIEPGVALLRREFRDPKLTVAEAAKICFVSEVYFRRIYKQHFGISPLQDILKLRFDYAAGLLRSGYYTVEQVARQAGFSDVRYFRTAFTKHFGLTPTQYKRKVNNSRGA